MDPEDTGKYAAAIALAIVLGAFALYLLWPVFGGGE